MHNSPAGPGVLEPPLTGQAPGSQKERETGQVSKSLLNVVPILFPTSPNPLLSLLSVKMPLFPSPHLGCVLWSLTPPLPHPILSVLHHLHFGT